MLGRGAALRMNLIAGAPLAIALALTVSAASARTAATPTAAPSTSTVRTATANAVTAAASADVSATYVLTGWTADRGAPAGDIYAMAQDREGQLWLGTAMGLVRFDGFEFTPWGAPGDAALPGTAVQALLAAKDGSLWVGFNDAAGPARIQRGRVTAYAREQGFTGGGIDALVEDPEGVLWAGARAGLFRFDGGRWTRVTMERAAADARIYSVHVDRTGKLWVGSTAGVFTRAAGADGFTLVDAQQAFVQTFAEDPSGTVWLGHTERIVASLTDQPRPTLASDVRLPTVGWRLLAGTEGDVWIAALGGGLLRMRDGHGARHVIERVRYEHTITGSPRALFQDRQHNVWVGMRGGGLLRVSEAAVRIDTRLAGLTNDGVRALTARPDGSVWVATGHNLNVFDGAAHTAYDIPQTMALHTDAHGQTWAATHDGVGRVIDGRFVPLRLPRPIRAERVTSLTSSADGSLWLCSVDEGVLRLSAGSLTEVRDETAVGGRTCTFAFTDASDRVWLGFSRGGVAVYERGHFTAYGDAEGLAAGTVMAIYEDRRGHIWIGTVSGLSRFADGRFATIDSDNGLPAGIVPSVIEDAQGALWVGVGSGAGLMRFDPDEMDRVAADASHRLRYALYDASDGLQGVLHWFSHPSAVRSGDGHLWFVTGTGIAVVDPQRIPARGIPTPPRIARATVNGQPVSLDNPVRLPVGPSTVQVGYTALALSGASKLRFRYRLDGLGTDWVDAGPQRVATFSNLPPGDYRFRVAATTDGAWTESEATFALVVPPPFYRTWPFYLACALAMGLVLWGYRLSGMRQVQRQFAVVLDERARLSREIHDTLLQDLGAIRLRLEGLSTQAARSDRAVGDSLRALHMQVGRCIREARNAIWELRTPRRDERDLVAGFEGLAADLHEHHSIDVPISVTGAPWQCAQEVEEQLLRIGQEALNNAVRHGRARRIDVALDYGQDALTVRVTDDGAGFDEAAMRPSDGHWGLLNMRERASSIGARLNLVSRVGLGTTVEVTTPRTRPLLSSRVAL
jgi:signal transduction histidine kinase/ligand-binding sensor domain-containing protein